MNVFGSSSQRQETNLVQKREIFFGQEILLQVKFLHTITLMSKSNLNNRLKMEDLEVKDWLI